MISDEENDENGGDGEDDDDIKCGWRRGSRIRCQYDQYLAVSMPVLFNDDDGGEYDVNNVNGDLFSPSTSKVIVHKYVRFSIYVCVWWSPWRYMMRYDNPIHSKSEEKNGWVSFSAQKNWRKKCVNRDDNCG